LRLVAADDEIQKGDARYVVYSDLNVEPLTYEGLFDEQTRATLGRLGVTLLKNRAGDCSFPFENGFFMMDSHNNSMVRATRLALIDLNIARGKQAIRDGHWKGNRTDFEPFKKIE
jgi:hypothetical protein